MKVKFWRGAELRGKERHHTVLAGLWIYSVLWLSGLVGLVYWRPIIFQMLVFVLLVFGTPDLRAPFYSYNKDEEVWRRDNERNGVQTGEPEVR